MPEIRTRFIILCDTRSGTTALTSTLKTHPDVHCYGHPFFENAKGHSRMNEFLHGAVDIEKRKIKPVEYAYDILNTTRGATTTGFKIWTSDYVGTNEALAALTADPTIKKIILNRENKLACISSAALVALKKENPEAFEDPDNRPQAVFEKDKFLRQTRNRIKRIESYPAMCTGEVLKLPYEGLMTTGLQAITQFLDLEEFDFVISTKKRNTGDIIGRYKPEFHDEIRATLDEIGHPEWVSEA